MEVWWFWRRWSRLEQVLVVEELLIKVLLVELV
jgi:hypothetical protein